MTTNGIQMNQGISLDTLEALFDQGTAEDKRSIKNRIETQNQKIRNLFEQRIHQLEEQKKNQWGGALFGFFVNIFAQATQFLNLLAPGVGTLVSKTMEALNQINPFTKKAQDAQLEAEKIEGEIKQEEGSGTRAQDYLNRLEEHGARMERRLIQAQENLEKAQEAAVRV